MTTIVYDHKNKEIAYDSRVSRGNLIITDNHEKLVTHDNGSFVFCGSTSEIQHAIEMFPENTQVPVDCCGLWVKEGEAYWIRCDGARVMPSKLLYSESCGSGQDFALSALDFGKSAKEAVEYAITRDASTGGQVRVIKL